MLMNHIYEQNRKNTTKRKNSISFSREEQRKQNVFTINRRLKRGDELVQI
jgi:hypothetical protein